MEPSFDVGTLFSQSEKNLNERDTRRYLAGASCAERLLRLPDERNKSLRKAKQEAV
jgi:hypothetical protein